MTLPRQLAFLLLALTPGLLPAQNLTPSAPAVFGYKDFSAEAKIEKEFLAVPSARLAGEELKTLTRAPHVASTPEDWRTAEYVAGKFRAAGLETEIVPYRVLLDLPKAESVQAYGPQGKLLMSGPTREYVPGDPYENDPRMVMPYNSSSGSGDVTAAAVYGNYCRLEDFNRLAARHIDLRDKIVLCRYGENFRGVKVYLAEQRGAAGVLLYSDPQDDGYVRGDAYPLGPWRPATAVQRGSVQYIFKYPGDPETPGVASTLNLPDSARVSPDGDQPHILSIPLSYQDAAPILRAMRGPAVPRGWQGGLPFTYHLGAGGVRVHMVSQQDDRRRIIWDVIGKIRGSELPDEWVVAGNHRDAWTFGAADPNSGTAAMLEAVHGIGVLLRAGWRPRRTMIFASWDAEEEGLIGSTEWVEQNAAALEQAVAYFNTDVGVSGPDFSASAAPLLRRFLRDVTRAVPSPLGGTVYEQWLLNRPAESATGGDRPQEGNLGSGSDFTPFLQHIGVPSTDISSDGPYGVYHSAFDDYAWFTQNADPHFLYLQQIARVFGLEALRMADADVLPYDYVAYARAIRGYIDAAQQKALGAGLKTLDFAPAEAAADRFSAAAEGVYGLQIAATGDSAQMARLNRALRQTEADFITSAGLPGRPWYRHILYAPGMFTGYSAVVIPGVNEAIDARDPSLARQQLAVLTLALTRAAQTLGSAR